MWLKEKGRQYYNKANEVKECNLRQGDHVLVKAPHENKLSPNFSLEKYEIMMSGII